MSGLQIFFLTVLFVSVTVGVFALAMILTRSSTAKSRLRELVRGRVTAATPELDVTASPWGGGMFRAVIDPMSRLAAPDKEEEISRFRERFVRAGLRSANAPLWFFAAKTLLALSLPLLMLLVLQVWAPKTTLVTDLLLSFISSGVGYYLPNYGLETLARRRQQQILDAFPDALDLLVVCVEAGLGLDLAIARVAEEIKLRSEVLSEELKFVGLDLRVGSSRERAMSNMAARIDLEEVSSFVAMLIQTERFGTSLADALRVHADTVRTKRRMRAEEAAAKISLKMLFPLIFFIFPALMVVLMGPAAIQIYRSMITH